MVSLNRKLKNLGPEKAVRLVNLQMQNDKAKTYLISPVTNMNE